MKCAHENCIKNAQLRGGGPAGGRHARGEGGQKWELSWKFINWHGHPKKNQHTYKTRPLQGLKGSLTVASSGSITPPTSCGQRKAFKSPTFLKGHILPPHSSPYPVGWGQHLAGYLTEKLSGSFQRHVNCWQLAITLFKHCPALLQVQWGLAKRQCLPNGWRHPGSIPSAISRTIYLMASALSPS